ncbi:hypothetical protein, partial [Pseudomonas aeruginosa]|uniref:hypothetical protein n=1 Tax=Pseudomonas aeruginosa TaxID=287 RepID=UPI003A5C5FC9
RHGVPGADDLAQSIAAHRPPGRRGPAPASPPAWRRAARAGTGTARTGRPR